MSDAPVKAKRSVCRRVGRVGLITGGVGVVALALSAFSGWLWLRSEAGERFLSQQIQSAVNGALAEGSLSIGSLDTDLWGHIGLSDVVLADAQGVEVVRVGRADVRIRLIPLLTKQRLVLHQVYLDRPTVTLVSDERGLNIVRLLPPGDPDAPSSEDLLPIELALHAIKIRHGDVTFNGSGLSQLSLDTRVDYLDDVLGVSGLGITGTLVGADLSGPVSVAGGLAYDYDADRIDLPQLRVMALDSALTATGDIRQLGSELTLGLDLLVDQLAM